MKENLDTSIMLRLQETEDGFVLHSYKKELIVIKDGEIQNDLTERQRKFVEVHIKR